MLAIGSLFIVAACAADSTSPDIRALNGDWSTGHTLVGLDMGLSLTWTDHAVRGTGAYVLANDSLRCGASSTTIPEGGPVTFTATVTPQSQVRGSLQFGGGASIPFDGTLIDSSRINGQNAKIDGAITAPDGTTCPWGLIHALVP